MRRGTLLLIVLIGIVLIAAGLIFVPPMVRSARTTSTPTATVVADTGGPPAPATPTPTMTLTPVPVSTSTPATKKQNWVLPTKQPWDFSKAPATPTVPSSGGNTPPAGYIDAWHGRQGRGDAEGFNIEFIVRYPQGYNATLELWACIEGNCDEWVNDSTKGIEPQRTWREGRPSFPKASWLDAPGNVLWEHDEAGKPGGQKWVMSVTTDVPVEYDWLMENGHVVDIPVYYDAGRTQLVPNVTIIRWVETSNFPF